MKPNASHIISLYYRANGGSLSPQEQMEWEAFQTEYPDEAKHLEELGASSIPQMIFEQRSPEKNAALEEQLWLNIQRRIEQQYQIPSIHRMRFLKTGWLRYVAVVLLVISGIAVYYVINGPISTPKILEQKKETLDILPGSNKAILTLSDGKQIELNTNASETINDGTISINNNNGQLSYKNTSVAAINTMRTPKGGQYQLTLSDGTKVWLNAASSITYPTAFTTHAREVKITGEAYFEVARNKEKPFIVLFNDTKVEVLGTSFNINAYDDEPDNRTTLIDGAVSVQHGNNKLMLQPGEQAVINQTLSLNKNVNVKQILSWKNGLFNFDGQDFQANMRQIERWYDVQVVYDGAVPDRKLLGWIHRNLPLSELIEGLQGSVARFRLEGRTLHILPL